MNFFDWLSSFFKPRGQTVEEIVASHSVGMTDVQKAQYWWELTQTIFNLLGKIDIPIFEIAPSDWLTLVQYNYPTLSDIKIADSQFFTTNLEGLQEILSRDWTNLVPYIAEIGDCDDFATRLYGHLCDYYQINAVVPVWGDTDGGSHGFNLAVIKDANSFITRLIEPQTDAIFIEEGPLGRYTPRKTAEEFGIKKLKIGDKR